MELVCEHESLRQRRQLKHHASIYHKDTPAAELSHTGSPFHGLALLRLGWCRHQCLDHQPIFQQGQLLVGARIIRDIDLAQTFDIDPNRLGLFSLFPSIGALFGVVGFAGFVNRVFGRVRAFQISTSLVIIGVIFQTFPDNYGEQPRNDAGGKLITGLLLFGRFVMGVGGDTNGQTLGYYVAEVSQKQVRGRTLIFVQQFASQFFGIAGTWIAYGIAYLPQDKSYSWKVANSLQFAPGVVFFFLCFWLPESPRWLARKYDSDDSPMVAALTVLRGRPASHPEVQEEAREIRAYNTWALQNESSSIFNILTEPRLRRRFFYVMVPWLAQIFCGVQLLTVSPRVRYRLAVLLIS